MNDRSLAMGQMEHGEPRIAAFIPSYNEPELLRRLLSSIALQERLPDLVVVWDSSTNERKRAHVRNVASDFDASYRELPNRVFDHGTTRDEAIREIRTEACRVVMLSQDVVLSDPRSIAVLMDVFESDPRCGAVYGRQVAFDEHTEDVKIVRTMSYPRDAVTLDSPTRRSFMSDAFGAYRIDALLEVGGFPRSCSFGEDVIAAIRLLEGGFRVRYEPAAKVTHSHQLSTTEAFQRGSAIAQLIARVHREFDCGFSGANARDQGAVLAAMLRKRKLAASARFLWTSTATVAGLTWWRLNDRLGSN